MESVGRKGALAGIAAAACVAAIVGLVLLASAAGGKNNSYEVRAIFDDAGNLIAGENVEIDGVKVGTVTSVTPTPQAKAAIVLDISNPGFRDFRSDASCTIRLQGLIGEKYVDCAPTQPRVEGTPPPPLLKKIPSGQEGAGEYLLPVENTHSPVDQDLVGDIQRLPERERFTIILNELGAGLAGRGSDLNAVVRRANPALQELDKVLTILADENHVLSKLAVDSNKALAPFAAVRQHVADYIEQSNTVAKASARQSAALAKNIKDFPPFLEQLVPSVERLGHFAEETKPAFTNLGIAAPSINHAFASLPGFSASSEKYFESLGNTAKLNGSALLAARPLLQRLKKLGAAGAPFAGNAAELLTSLKNTGGLERLLDFIFLGTGASNGYDALGHFLRAEGVGDSTCLKYAISFNGNCYRKLRSLGSTETSATAARAASSGGEPTGVIMARTLAVIKGETPAQAIAEYPGPETASELRSVAAAAGQSTTASSPSSSASAAASGGAGFNAAEGLAGNMLLNYLLGSE